MSKAYHRKISVDVDLLPSPSSAKINCDRVNNPREIDDRSMFAITNSQKGHNIFMMAQLLSSELSQ